MQPQLARDLLPEGFRVARAANDLLFSEDGDRYIDLLCGCGAAFLGHAAPGIVSRVQEQLAAVWITGALPTDIAREATAAVETFFPASHRLAGLYSTGMEAAEFALRIARHATGRSGVVGFEHCMHGKSTATASLGWQSDLVHLPDFQRLPYLPLASEVGILERLQDALAGHSIAAVFVEPILGSSGGHLASPRLLQQMSALCNDTGTLLVVDEIFSGFHRTGEAFLHQELGVTPDIVLIGKAMGNGFPVSGVILDRRYAIEPVMLPGSTYAGNPLAAAAVAATLQELRSVDRRAQVAEIEQILSAQLKSLRELGIVVRGKGALFVLELPPSLPIRELVARIVRAGVIVSPTASFVRLLPPATIPADHLVEACEIIQRACRETAG